LASQPTPGSSGQRPGHRIENSPASHLLLGSSDFKCRSHPGQDLDGLNPPMDGGAGLKESMINPTVDELLSLLLSCVPFLTHPTAHVQQTLRSLDREDQWRPRIRRLQRRRYIRPAPACAHFPYCPSPTPWNLTIHRQQAALSSTGPQRVTPATLSGTVRPNQPLYLPRIQGPSLTSLPSTGPRHVTAATLSGTVPAPGPSPDFSWAKV
jgi:hypothetical protein